MLKTCRPNQISIALCTFRRASLRQTLDSLERQKLPQNVSLQVILVDNDRDTSARAIAEEARTRGMDLVYVHEPARNISIVRNTGLEKATGDFVAFLDDDEEADSDWLASLLQALQDFNADAAIGQVIASYDPNSDPWIAAGSPFARPPSPRGTVLTTGATNNALVRLEAIRRIGLRFDERFGTTGGEDSAFFKALAHSGAKVVAAPDAIVRETLPASRLTWPWMRDRALRNGFLYAWHNHDGATFLEKGKLALHYGGYVAIAMVWFALTRFTSPRGSVEAWTKWHLNRGKLRFLRGKPAPSWL